jgi:hypothetical protein
VTVPPERFGSDKNEPFLFLDFRVMALRSQAVHKDTPSPAAHSVRLPSISALLACFWTLGLLQRIRGR